jgi:hypothetical protein
MEECILFMVGLQLFIVGLQLFMALTILIPTKAQLDTDAETALPLATQGSRLDVFKQAIGMLVQAKRRVRPSSLFALATLTESGQLVVPPGTAEAFSSALARVQPSQISFPTVILAMNSACELVCTPAAPHWLEGSGLEEVGTKH